MIFALGGRNKLVCEFSATPTYDELEGASQRGRTMKRNMAGAAVLSGKRTINLAAGSRHQLKKQLL